MLILNWAGRDLDAVEVINGEILLFSGQISFINVRALWHLINLKVS
jgi:hypothetical protein